MTFSFNDNDRRKLTIDGLSSTIQPTSVALAIDGTEYPTAPTTTGSGPYAVSAVTTGWFAGPAHPSPNGAVVLAYGIHAIEVRVTASDGTTLARPFPSFRISPDV